MRFLNSLLILIVCTKNHPLIKSVTKLFYNCGCCKRYIMAESFYKCEECITNVHFCFDCIDPKQDEDSGNVTFLLLKKIIKPLKK